MPIGASANFITSFLGTEVFASTNTNLVDQNSQNGLALEANVSSLVMADDKKNNTIDPGIEVGIVADTALSPVTGPLGVSDGTEVLDDFSPENDMTIYVVHKGDTISTIAEMFEVTPDTVYAFNDMKKGQVPQEGDILFILPFSGIKHTVVKGETLKGIAVKYNVDVNEITAYNDLDEDLQIAVGDDLIIPGASIIAEKKVVSTPKVVKNYYSSSSLQNISGYFINPVPTGRKTQGLHGPGHRGIDIGAPVGTPIYASASGRVAIVKSGCVVGKRNCGGGYGNMLIIEHPNDTKTLSAHMSKVAVSTGAQVSRGQIIGYVGNTGKSTGPHLHFEVFNAKNPGSDWSWAK